jgi:hypothetical protein
VSPDRFGVGQTHLVSHNPHHPSLHLKRIRRFWSARIDLSSRPLGVDIPGVLWFWIVKEFFLSSLNPFFENLEK